MDQEDSDDWFVVYGGAINLTGLCSNIPIKCLWDDELETWSDDDGNFEISELGLVKGPGRVIFSSTSKKDVENWILGVRATTLLLRDWVAFGCLNCGRDVIAEDNNLCTFCDVSKTQGNKEEISNDSSFQK